MQKVAYLNLIFKIFLSFRLYSRKSTVAFANQQPQMVDNDSFT